MVCAYFDSKDIPILSALRLIPVDQILDIVENIDLYPIQKLNEVLVRVIFKDLEPTPVFSFREEMKKVKSLVKLVSFKKLIFKKMMSGRVHAVKTIKKLRDIAEKIRKDQQALKASILRKNSSEPQSEGVFNENDDQTQKFQNNPKIQRYGPARNFMINNSNIFVFFIDKGFMFVMREISDMRSHLDIYKNLDKMISEEALENMLKVFLLGLSGKKPLLFRGVRPQLVDPGNKDQHQMNSFFNFLKSSKEIGEEQAGSSGDFSFMMDMMSEKSSSLFNFDS